MPYTKAYSGKTRRGGRRALARGSNPGRMGTVKTDVRELCDSTRFSSAGGPVCVPAQSQTPGLLLPVSVPASPRHGCIGAGLEPLQPGSDLSSARPHQGGGQTADRIQGGGVLVLPDSRALLRFIPARFFRKELTMDSPFQQLFNGTVLASKGYDRFRAWSF